MKNATLLLVRDLREAVTLANKISAEHVAIATKRPGEIALRLTTSGAIFMGGISPVVGGDFLAGPSHELPTGGAGKSFAGLTADQFQHRTSVVMFDEPSLRASLADHRNLQQDRGSRCPWPFGFDSTAQGRELRKKGCRP